MAKKKDKKCSLLTSKCLPIMLLSIGLAIIFILPGVNKLMDPAMTKGMLSSLFGMSDLALELTYWLLVAVEVIGGITLLIGKWVPGWFYHIMVTGLFIVICVAIGSVHVPGLLGGDARSLMDVLMLVHVNLTLLALFVFKSQCDCKK